MNAERPPALAEGARVPQNHTSRAAASQVETRDVRPFLVQSLEASPQQPMRACEADASSSTANRSHAVAFSPSTLRIHVTAAPHVRQRPISGSRCLGHAT